MKITITYSDNCTETLTAKDYSFTEDMCLLVIETEAGTRYTWLPNTKVVEIQDKTLKAVD